MLPFAQPQISEQEQQAVIGVLASGRFVHGEHTQNFETSFAQRMGVKHAISLSNCTAGLFLSLHCLGIGAGDKVIVPAMTHVATAHAVCLTGADPVFVDVVPHTGNLDLAKVSALKDKAIRAIIPVHYLGLPVDMSRLLSLASHNGWHVVEDCALALDATCAGKKVGSFGSTGCFSFYPTKHMTSIEGGMLTTSDDVLAEKIRKARAFGYDKMLGERKTPGVYDISDLGGNFRMDEVRAAVGCIQLEKLDDFLFARNRNFHILDATLSHIPSLHTFPSIDHTRVSSHYCYNIVLAMQQDRTPFLEALNDKGIGYSVHYPQALPLSSYYKKRYGYDRADFPIAAWLADKSISLPVGPHISQEQAAFIAQSVAEIATSLSKESLPT